MVTTTMASTTTTTMVTTTMASTTTTTTKSPQSRKVETRKVRKESEDLFFGNTRIWSPYYKPFLKMDQTRAIIFGQTQGSFFIWKQVHCHVVQQMIDQIFHLSQEINEQFKTRWNRWNTLKEISREKSWPALGFDSSTFQPKTSSLSWFPFIMVVSYVFNHGWSLIGSHWPLGDP